MEEVMMKPAFQLIMRQGPTPGLTFDLVNPEIDIGRDTTNDFVINDAEVSRKHAILRLESGSYVIEDQGSTNGTFINGQRLMGPHSLGVGEEIMLGENVRLTFEAVRPELAATIVGTMTEDIPPAYPHEQKPAAQQMFVVPPQPAASPYSAQQSLPAEGELPQPADRKNSQFLWLTAACGCLVIVAVICAAVVLVIEYFNLWCTLFGAIIPGCN